MPDRRVLSWDVALAAAGAAALIVEGQLRSSSALSPGAYVLAIAAAAALMWRARSPLAALVGVETGAVACAAVFHASWSASVGAMDLCPKNSFRSIYASNVSFRSSVLSFSKG